MKKIIVALLWGIFMCGPLWAEEVGKEDSKHEKIELHHLTNKALLEQAQTFFDKASADSMGELRALSKSEIFLNQGRQKSESSEIPAEELPPSSEELSSLELAKVTSEHAKIRFDAMKKRLELIEAEKTLLEKLIAQTETARTAVNTFSKKLEELNLFSIEISLRVDDGTLSINEVPELFQPENMENREQEIHIQQDELEKKTEVAQKELENVVSRIKEAKNALGKAEFRHSSAKENHSRQLRSHDLEKEYSLQKPERLSAQFSELQEEQVWLRATFDMALKRLTDIQTDSARIQKELEALLPPETERLQAVSSEEPQESFKTLNELIVYNDKRTEKLGELRSSLKNLVKRGESLEGDATILAEHLFTMQVIAKILEDFADSGKTDLTLIPEASRSESLATGAAVVSKQTSESLAATQKAREQLAQIDEEVKKSGTARKKAQDLLANLKKTSESVLETRQWESAIKDLTARKLVQNFQELTEKLKEKKPVLQKYREESEGAYQAVKDEKLKLASLKDPLLRSSRKGFLEDKENILKKLCEFAGVDLSAKSREKSPGPTDVSAKTDEPEADTEQPSEKSKKSEESKKSEKSKKKEAPLPDSGIEIYQNRLSTRVRIIQEQQKHRAELVKALKSLNQHLGQYVIVLEETRKLAIQRYVSAVEMKKRLGQGQLNSSDIPEGITEVLKRDMISWLESEAAEAVNFQIRAREESEIFDRHDENIKEISKLSTEIQTLAGRRLDILYKLKEREQNFEQKREALSETELQSLDQKALRRLEAEDRISEFLLGFIPLKRVKNLTGLMKAYYTELTELEKKQENLNGQRALTELLIRLSEEEKPLISELLPFLHRQRQQLEIEKEEYRVRIRARLIPEKAEKILSSFELKTGRRLSTLGPIQEEHREKEIRRAAEFLFEKHTEIVAADKWIALFEQRLTPSGINKEIGKYQYGIGMLDTRDSGIQRRIEYISGHSPDELAKLSPDEAPETENDRRSFLKGRIGMLRAERYQVQTRQAGVVVAKVTVIFLIAILITWLVGRLFHRIMTHSQKTDGKKSLGKIAVFRLLRTLCIFLIWFLAIVSILNALGFNVGAIIAGLGIGGIAFALASKDTIADMIGGVNLFLSKAFKVGDRILFKGEDADVESIGLQYTRLRMDATKFLVTVPNSQLSQTELFNVTSAPGYFVNINLALSVRNTKAQAELAIKLIREIIEQNSETKLDNIRLASFDNCSFVISLRYCVIDFSLRHPVRTQIHGEIVRRIQENDIELSFTPVFLVK